MKNLNEIDVGSYFKKIGKKFTVLLFVNIGLLTAITYTGISKMDGVSLLTSSLENKLSEKEMDELRVLKEKKELNNLELELIEMKETLFDRDVNVQLMNVLKDVETLMVEHSFNNTKHDVLPLRRNKEIYELPIRIEFIGEYKKVVQFLEDVNSTEYPIALRDLRVFIPEEDFENEFKGSTKIKTILEILIYEDYDYVEQLKEKVEEKKEDTPFGYFVYKTPENINEGIEDYQEYLEQFNREIEEAMREEAAFSENANNGNYESE